MSTADPLRAVLIARIRLGVRRATGQAVDVDRLLADPALAAGTIAVWRSFGVKELNGLLDQYEAHLRAMASPAAPAKPTPAKPPPPPPVPDPAPPDADPPKPPADRRYLRGAR